MPRRSTFIVPSAPILREKSPVGPGWIHEVKFDGYRVQLHKTAKGAEIYSRNGAPFASRFPDIAYMVAHLPAKSAILDGELVAHNAKGLPAFHDLHLKRAPAEALAVWAFDLLEIDGVDLRHLALETRRARLERLIAKADLPAIRLSEAFDDAHRLLAACEERGLEGIVSKRLGSSYVSGRTKNWIKVKCPAWREANRERFKMFEER